MIQPKKYIEETRHPSSPISATSYFSHMELNSKDSAKVGKIVFEKTPIQVSIKDPICDISLKETSEFVSSMPFKRSHSTNNRVVYQERRDGKLDSPATPGFRPANFRSSPGNNLSLQRKSVSSKWEDAEKWLVSSSSYKESPSHLIRYAKQPDQVSNFRRSCDSMGREGVKFEEKIQDFTVQIVPSMVKPLVPADAFMKDKFASESEQFVSAYSNVTKPTLLFDNIIARTNYGTGMRDVGTNVASITPPIEGTSPVRHNTPTSKSGFLLQANETIDFAKLKLCNEFDMVLPNWNSKEEEEEDVSKSLRHFEMSRKSFAESRACAWEEEERSKSCMRYQREEAKIQAWVNLENAKAEAQSRKLEVKIQKMRSDLEEKLMKRMAIVHRKAEEWRLSAQMQHSQQIQRALQNAQKMRNEKSLVLHGNTYTAPCACFSCNNNI